MFEAKIKGSNTIISYHDFLHRLKGKYQNKEIELECPECSGPLYLYGDKSLEVIGRFQHFPGTTCISNEDFCKGIKGPRSFNIENGQRLRGLVETKEFASKLYCFCLKMCGTGNLTISKFCSLIKKADTKKLWIAAGIEEWVIGFVLLLFDDFKGRYSNEEQKRRRYANEGEEDATYTFRFVLVKENDLQVQSIHLDEIWQEKNFYLKKVFDSGKMMKVANNPFPVSRALYEKFLSRYDWTLQKLGDALVKEIKKMRVKDDADIKK